MTWGTSQTVQATGFGPNDIVVAQFKTSAITTATGKGYIQAVEFGDVPSGRTAALSDTPCDLVGLPKVGGSGNSAFGPNDNAPWAYFSLVTLKSGYPTLKPSTTYYFNITNSPNSSCGTGVCDMLITINKPTGS